MRGIGYKYVGMKTTSRFRNIPHRFALCGALLVAALVLLSGCPRPVASLDEDDFRDPLLRKAQSRMRQGDRDGAIDSLNRALERRPNLAQAHLEIGLLFDEHKRDYVRAIYHYQRYLELRPSAQKRSLIEDLIKKAKMSYVAEVSDQFGEAAKKIQALEEENARLKSGLGEARMRPEANVPKAGEVPKIEQPTAAKMSASVPVQGPGAVAPTSGVYRVQAGDTLSSIAASVYNDPRKWKAILDANTTVLPSPEKLKSGQVLVIPPRESLR